LAITEPFTNFSHCGTHKTHDLGEDSFHVYHKEYLHRTASLKTLPLDLELPFQGKEYDPPYSKETAKKVNVFVPETTYRLVVRVF
jgi:hypothetical protein